MQLTQNFSHSDTNCYNFFFQQVFPFFFDFTETCVADRYTHLVSFSGSCTYSDKFGVECDLIAIFTSIFLWKSQTWLQKLSGGSFLVILSYQNRSGKPSTDLCWYPTYVYVEDSLGNATFVFHSKL